MNVLITGATGYIGSHIASSLVLNGHSVYATCRTGSVFDKCSGFSDKLFWINQDLANWKDRLENGSIDMLIHTAWSGVSASGRYDWDIQMTNFYYAKSIIDWAVSLGVKKIICLGSQAEYGQFSSFVSEDRVPYPTDAYGAVKILSLNYLRNKAFVGSFSWYWLRVFSILGENENETWLLPQVLSKLLSGYKIDLTEGKQQYDYLYMGDFISRLNQVIDHTGNDSGVYNICSGRGVEIRQLLLLIADKLGVSSSLLNFGAVSYRTNQNMSMVGSPVRFENTFVKLPLEPLEVTVTRLTEFYKKKRI